MSAAFPRNTATLINFGLETVVSVLVSTVHARAYRTMNEKFSILQEVELGAVLKISSSIYGNICQQNTN